jgi:hypothetical protein
VWLISGLTSDIAIRARKEAIIEVEIRNKRQTVKMSAIEKTFPKPKIELYSGQYYAACALGGVIGECSSFQLLESQTMASSRRALADSIAYSLWANSYGCHTPGSCENSAPGRQ